MGHKADGAVSKPYQAKDWLFSKQAVAQSLWPGTTDTAPWMVFIADEIHRAGGMVAALLKAEMTRPGKI